MNKTPNVFLPGLGKQSDIFFSQVNLSDKNVLLIGPNQEEIAIEFTQRGAGSVIIIVDDEDSLFKSKYLLSAFKDISVRFMDYDNTDFREERFDMVYAQASISVHRRGKILKEIKRILKPEGTLCVGEIVNTQKEVPQFIKDIRNNAGISAFYTEELQKVYSDAGFQFITEYNLESTLKDFYTGSIQLLKENIDKLPENEKSYYKKTLHMISHESNVYLKLGGERFMGFKMIIVRKKAP